MDKIFLKGFSRVHGSGVDLHLQMSTTSADFINKIAQT